MGRQRDLAVLVDEEYLHSELQKQQEDTPVSEEVVQYDEPQSHTVATNPNSDGKDLGLTGPASDLQCKGGVGALKPISGAWPLEHARNRRK